MAEPNSFTRGVIDIVRRIPKGKVATYKQVAALARKPGASRGVAWILNSCSKKYRLPWHRVLSSKGRIAFPPGTSHFLLQKRLLKSERVAVCVAGEIDMDRYQWKKKARTVRPRGQPRMFG